MKSIRVIYNNLKTQRENQSMICKFKDDVDTLDNDIFFKQLLSKEKASYPQEFNKEDIEIVKRDWEMNYDLLYGTIELNNGRIININEINPLASNYIVWGLQNLYNLKDLNENDIKNMDLEISTNKILFLSQKYPAKFLSLTHEEFAIHECENYECVGSSTNDNYKAFATIKSLLGNEINDIEKSFDFER